MLAVYLFRPVKGVKVHMRLRGMKHSPNVDYRDVVVVRPIVPAIVSGYLVSKRYERGLLWVWKLLTSPLFSTIKVDESAGWTHTDIGQTSISGYFM
jgi:hypothetical protein